MEAVTTHHKLRFLQGGGELGTITRAHNWDATSLGSPYTWPQSLRTTLGILLHSAFPMFLFWGPERLCFYNDAYRPSLGDEGKHPCVGKPGKEVWPEIWDFIGPLIEQVISTGEPVWYEDQFLPIQRNGRLEDVYWTFSYSPAYGDSGEISGVLVTCTETTRAVEERRKLETSQRHFRELIMAAEFSIALLTGRELRIEIANERNIRDWGKGPDVIGKTVAEALPELAGQPFLKLLDDVFTTGVPYYGYAEPATFMAEGKPELKYYDFAYKPMRNAEGEIWAILVTGTEVTKSIMQQEALKASEQRFRNLVMQAPFGVAVYRGRQLISETVNEQTLQLMGRKREEMEGRPLFDAMPQIREAMEPVIRNIIQDGIVVQRTEVPTRVIREGREELAYFNSTWTPFRDDDGAIAGVMAVGYDVTGQVLSRQAIRQAAQRFRAAIDAVQGILWTNDAEGKMIGEQPGWASLTGQSPEQYQNYGWAEAVHPEDAQPTIEAWEDAVKGRKTFIHEHRVRRADGSWGSYAVRAVPMMDEVGAIREWVGVHTDVTEQRGAEAALQESESRFRALIEEAPVATCLFVGRELRIEVANSAMIAHMGKGAAVLGKPLAEALPELRGQPFLAILNEIFDSGETFDAKAMPATLIIDGKPQQRYFDYTFKPLRAPAGDVWAIIDMSVDVTEQVLAQQRIKENSRQLLASFEQSPVGIAIVDGDEALTFRMANPFYCSLAGRTPEDIVGKPLFEALPEIKGQGFDGLLRGVINTGVAYIANEQPVELLRAERLETLYLDFAYQPRREANGQISGVLAVITDVTQQVVARKAVEDSALSLRSVVDSAPFPIGIYEGRELRITLANDSIKAAYGKGPDVEGRLYTEVLPELEGSGIFEQLRSVIDTGEPVHMRSQRVDLVQDGVMTENYFNYSFTPLRNAAGEVYAVMNTAADVTDVVKSKQKIEEAEAGLRGAIELAELGTWEIDMVNRLLDYDARTRMWFGIGPDEIITPERAYVPVREADRPRIKAAIEHAVTPGTDGIYDIEYTIDTPDGHERILHAQGKAFYNEAGLAYKIAGSAQDVTAIRHRQAELERQVQERTAELAAKAQELAAANENLQRSNEELAQYAYVASHDLQEPLRKIRVFSGMLEKQEGLSDHSRELVQKVDAASQRMGLLIKDLLEFSRLLNSDSLVRPVDLNEVCKAVVSDFELSIREQNAVIVIGTMPRIEAVALQMNQLFYNLVSNALKFSSKDLPPRIEISSRPMMPEETRRHVSSPNPAWLYYDITVKDNGIGFDTKYAEQIFEVFKRLHGREIYPGSGIGLALCRRIAVNALGYLYAESVTGHGATFHIILPDRLA